MFLKTVLEYKELISESYWYHADFESMLSVIDSDVDFICERGVKDYTFGMERVYFVDLASWGTILKYTYILENGDTLIKTYSVYTNNDVYCYDEEKTIALVREMNPQMPIDSLLDS